MQAVEVDGVSIVVIRKRDGTFRALRNRCAHQGAALSDGRLVPLVLGLQTGEYHLSPDKEVVRCPWHHYEFDLETGRSLVFPDRIRARAYRVVVENDKVMVERQR
jgi:3-phenylpropionate/trans-cinnamate dioxygenase ferredoxin subunit